MAQIPAELPVPLYAAGVPEAQQYMINVLQQYGGLSVEEAVTEASKLKCTMAIIHDMREDSLVEIYGIYGTFMYREMHTPHEMVHTFIHKQWSSLLQYWGSRELRTSVGATCQPVIDGEPLNLEQ